MKSLWLILAVLASPAWQTPGTADVVAEVRAAIDARALDRAEAILAKRRAEQGATPEVIEALSWLGKGALTAKEFDRAGRYAREAEQLAAGAAGKRLDDEPHLVTALGNAIEVEAQVKVEAGGRSDALYFLQRELDTYKNTAIHKKIQKNINLLSLEGHPAPALETAEFIGPAPPSLDQLKGKVVVLFFWAHWCPDCKIQGPILAKLFAKYQRQGLAIVAPTQRYGYVSAGAPAPPDEELRHIISVRDTYYGFLAKVPVPLSEANLKLYGVSSTPTLAILDRQGIVRLYHPGRMTEGELDAKIRPLLK